MNLCGGAPPSRSLANAVGPRGFTLGALPYVGFRPILTSSSRSFVPAASPDRHADRGSRAGGGSGCRNRIRGPPLLICGRYADVAGDRLYWQVCLSVPRFLCSSLSRAQGLLYSSILIHLTPLPLVHRPELSKREAAAVPAQQGVGSLRWMECLI